MIEQKLSLRGGDSLIFGIGMPVGVLILIGMIAGNKTVNVGDYTFLQSAFASLIAVGICASAFMGIPLTIADYRDKKILKHFFVTPCSPMMLLGAVILCHVVIAIVCASLVSLTAVLGFGYKMEGELLLFIVCWFLTLISMFSIGMLLASLCHTVKLANAITSIVYFPMLFLSGATIPFEIFPVGLQKVANYLPLTQGIKLMKAVSLGTNIDGVMTKIIFLIVITMICTIISLKTFRWEA